MRCSRNIHPGGMIKEEIEYRKLSKRELSKKMDISYKLFTDILNEKKPLTEDIAVKLEKVLGIPAYFYMSIQVDYNIRALEENKKHVKLLEKLRNLGKNVAL